MYFFLCFLGLLCVCSTEGCPDNCTCEEYQSVCQIQQCSDDLPFEYTDFLKIKGALCQRHKDFLKSLSPNTIIVVTDDFVVTDDSCGGLCNCRDETEDVPTEVIPEHNFVPVDEPEPLPEIVPPIEVPEPLPEMQPEPEPLPEIMPVPEPEQPEQPEPLPEIMPAPEPERPEPEQAEPEQAEPEQAEPEQVEPEQAEPEQSEPEEELTTKDMMSEVTTEPTILTTFYCDNEEDGNQSSTVSIY